MTQVIIDLDKDPQKLLPKIYPLEKTSIGILNVMNIANIYLCQSRVPYLNCFCPPNI